jgi:hypothetical protein
MRVSSCIVIETALEIYYIFTLSLNIIARRVTLTENGASGSRQVNGIEAKKRENGKCIMTKGS